MKMKKYVIFVKKNLKINIWTIKNIVRLWTDHNIDNNSIFCLLMYDAIRSSLSKLSRMLGVTKQLGKISITFGCDQEIFHTFLYSYTNHEQISLYMAPLKQFFFHTLSRSYPHLKQSLIAIDIFQQFFCIFTGSCTEKRRVLKQIAPL